MKCCACFPLMIDLGERFIFHFTKVMEKSQLTVSATKIPRERLMNIWLAKYFFFRNYEKKKPWKHRSSCKILFSLLSLCKINSFFCSWITGQKKQFLFSLLTSAYNLHFAYQLFKSFLLQLQRKKSSPLSKLPIAKILTKDNKEQPELRIKGKKKRGWASGYLPE